MLRLSNNYINRSILSLRNGGVIGNAVTPVINPNNLKIEGWYSENSYEKGTYVLPTSEVRESINKGLVVDDHEALTHPDDMIRLKDVISLEFELIGKTVVTESKHKIGKISDYAVEDSSYYIQKLYVDPPIVKSLTSDQKIIDRNQIVEITDKKIIVRDLDIKVKAGNPLRASA
jgi:sporulation protein YlmC with PRC-barrel domain